MEIAIVLLQFFSVWEQYFTILYSLITKIIIYTFGFVLTKTCNNREREIGKSTSV